MSNRHRPYATKTQRHGCLLILAAIDLVSVPTAGADTVFIFLLLSKPFLAFSIAEGRVASPVTGRSGNFGEGNRGESNVDEDELHRAAEWDSSVVRQAEGPGCRYAYTGL